MRRLIIRISRPRCGNTFLSKLMMEKCDINNIGEINGFIYKAKYKDVPNPWKMLSLQDMIDTIEYLNLQEFNMMNDTRYLEGLQNTYNVVKYGLYRDNCLKSALSAFIKFKWKDAKPITELTAHDINKKVKQYEVMQDKIKSIVDPKFLYRYEDLYRDKEFRQEYFLKMMSDLEIPMKNTDFSSISYQPKDVIKDHNYYYQFINREVVEEASRLTGYRLDQLD